MMPARDDDNLSDPDAKSAIVADLTPTDTDADRDRAVALDLMTGMQATIEALRRDNWRLIDKAARDAVPQVWQALKSAASLVGEPYQNVRYWCEQGVIVSERRGGRVFVEMGGLQAHVALRRSGGK
jgi:hypothetical protein